MDYKGTFKSAVTRMDALQAEHSLAERKVIEIGQEMSKLNDVMTALSPLANEKVALSDEVTEILQSFKQSETITERIRVVLASKPAQAFYPLHIRTELEALKYDLAKHPNPMATIHGVLKRLVDQQYAKLAPQADGKMAYTWNPAAPKS
jgi:hypothetical protein